MTTDTVFKRALADYLHNHHSLIANTVIENLPEEITISTEDSADLFAAPEKVLYIFAKIVHLYMKVMNDRGKINSIDIKKDESDFVMNIGYYEEEYNSLEVI